jgi:hypothetical protein
MSNSDKSIYIEIGRKMREIPQEMASSSYKWEELVEKLYASEDDALHKIGVSELYELLHKRPLSGSIKPERTKTYA